MGEKTDLDNLFTNLIAEKEGIKPEEVTREYIHEQREKRRFDDVRYNIYSNSGCGIGLTHFTRNEYDWIEKIVDEVMALV